MSTDLYKSVLNNDGEGLTYGDLNDSQRFLAARLNDQFFEKLIGSDSNLDPEFGSQKGANASTSLAYCLNVGGANPKQGSANNKVKISAGTLFQKTGNASGNEPTLLAYTFDGTDELTIANGDVANPRVDMIQMKLEYLETDLQTRDFEDATTHVLTTTTPNKKRQVKCTLSVKTGTPAASPVYPTPDALNVPIACVVVGTNYVAAAGLKYVDSAGAVAVLHDLRMPLRIRKSITRPTDFLYDEQDFTRNGSSKILSIPACMAFDFSGSHTAHNDHFDISISANDVVYPISLPDGAVISAYSLYVKKQTNGSATITADIFKTVGTTGVATSQGVSQTNNANAPGFIVLGQACSIPVVGGSQYFLKFTGGSSVTPTNDLIYNLEITYYFDQAWVRGTQQRKVTCQNSAASPANALLAPCSQSLGRVVGLSMLTSNGTAAVAKLVGLADAGTDAELSTVSGLITAGGTPADVKGSRATYVEGNQVFSAGPTVLGNGTHYPPVWANGKRCQDEGFSLGSGSQAELDSLAVKFNPLTGLVIYSVTYYIAEGV